MEDVIRWDLCIQYVLEALLHFRDDTSHASDSHFDLDVMLSNVESLTSAVSELGGMDVYPAMGNHDTHPKSQFPQQVVYLYLVCIFYSK